MKMTYIPKIQGNMKGYKTIYTTRATSRIIDGSYNSIYKGRSMNFDELREYVVGDDIKDVDWKASSRSQKILVRQYIAEKKHNLMLVMDAGRKMLANANETQEKREIALMAAGTLAYMVGSNGDFVSCTYAAKDGVKHFPFKTGLMNVENILAAYNSDVNVDCRSGISQSLEFIIRNFRRRMIMLIVTDAEGIMEIDEGLIRQLKVIHDILLVKVSDADAMGKRVFDMENDMYIPDFFGKDKKLARIESQRRMQLERQCSDKLKKLGVSCVCVSELENIEERIVDLLGRHKNESSLR